MQQSHATGMYKQSDKHLINQTEPVQGLHG